MDIKFCTKRHLASHRESLIFYSIYFAAHAKFQLLIEIGEYARCVALFIQTKYYKQLRQDFESVHGFASHSIDLIHKMAVN